MTKTTVICMVPARNESWVLPHLIESAQQWADVIIIGDHNSADNSAEIAQRYDYVKLITLHNPAYDEDIRRKVLLEEARKIPGKRLIVSIDADEMISANWANSPEWQQMLNAAPGTSFRFDWVELLPGLEQACVFGMTAAFVDDDSEYQGVKIHSPRIPATGGEVVALQQIKLLHYDLVDPQRMLSRHRWYKCWEYLENHKRPWAVCVTYQDTRFKRYDAPVVPVEPAWVEGYQWLDDYRAQAPKVAKRYWWDEEVLNYFDRYGLHHFRKLNIWEADWNKKAELLGRANQSSHKYDDPRAAYEHWIHGFIQRYREELKLKQKLPFRLANLAGKYLLRPLGW